ncbi:SpoVK/Ycf46/Vps4 family AAA+-type ATPase [Pedobacter sp. AK017]|uniref:AAA family ATPase n=1 Tax=Pedobacter sp. AK017 TaxID=2723073 RepID=UPI001616FBEA|nr:ATP-binding protein [Pedobacter sp. AK017]MBB5440243.1 SpoVK/Ycf46/Vps4 family AAA+-type ATPase [Pedobacter sp. AK017]
MNQDLLLRLFRSIDGEHTDDIVKVAGVIIEDERKKGHNKLADRLTSILTRNIKTNQSFKGELRNIFGNSVLIPKDTRSNIPLAIEIPREELRHEMILSDEVDQKIQRIEKEFLARERLAHFGLKPRRRILFHGYPGCGKSMSAERIAWNIGLPFLKVKFEAVVSSYLGESASNLSKLFEAIKTFPCVLLLDEFDFIAKSRDNKQDVGEMHRIVNILLNILEDFNGPGLIIATTNLEGSIDKAIFRRFDDIIELPKPSKIEIFGILKATLGSIKVDKKVDWKKVSEQLDGFSAALVVKVATDAAKLSVILGEGVINDHFISQSLKENELYNK